MTSVQLDKNLIAYYKLPSTKDFSKNELSIVRYGTGQLFQLGYDSTLWSKFNGTDDYYSNDSFPSLSTSSSFTIIINLMLDNFSSVYPQLLSIPTIHTRPFIVAASAEAGSKGFYFGSIANFPAYKTNQTLKINTPYIVVVTYNGLGATDKNNYKCYVNSDRQTLSTAAAIISSNNNFYIGTRMVTTTMQYPFAGLIKYVKIYNKVLTANEVDELTRERNVIL